METEYITYTPNFGSQDRTTTNHAEISPAQNRPNILQDNYSGKEYSERTIADISKSLQVFALRLPYGFTNKPRTEQSLRESYYFTVARTPQDAIDNAYAIRGYWFKGTRIQGISKLPPDEITTLLNVIVCTPEVCIQQFMAHGFFGRRKDGTEVYIYTDNDGQTRIDVSSNHPYSKYSRGCLTPYRR
jgi:hypothetical protein